MKCLIIITGLALVVPGLLFAQINWTEHTIADFFDGAYSVFAIDLDGDDNIDVLGAANVADDIAWWENDGGSPPNFIEHTIADNFNGARSVYAIDLDDDGDTDVLGAANVADDITWWENDGGSPPNFTEHTIADNFDGAWSVFAIDLDDDNDIDVLGAANVADDIAWWENDGSENFTEHTIAGNFDGARSVYAIDLDGDDDIDVLGAAFLADDITWWENDGSENFTEHTIADNFDGASSVYAIDVDGDNDIDVLGVSSLDSDIAWWENDGGSPLNFTKHTITYNFVAAICVYAIDVDDDDDIDVLGAAFLADNITWWEYDLNPDVLDVSTISIDIDSPQPEGTILSPQATVKNMGTNIETFDVTCEIDPDAYSSTETVTDLAPGESIQVTFSPDFTFESGSYTVKVYTQLADDTYPTNDTLEKVIETYDPGVAEGIPDIPEAFSFSPPTISRGKANIELTLPTATKVDLLVYDAVGRLSQTVISETFSAGNHSMSVNFNLPAGVYFYHLKTASGENTLQKFLLVK